MNKHADAVFRAAVGAHVFVVVSWLLGVSALCLFKLPAASLSPACSRLECVMFIWCRCRRQPLVCFNTVAFFTSPCRFNSSLSSQPRDTPPL